MGFSRFSGLDVELHVPHMAAAQYERSGTRASAHPDPDPDPELRIKSPSSVPDPSVPDHRMHYLNSDVELGVRSIPVPYLFHTRSRPHKVFSTYSPCISVGTSKRQSSFHTLRIKYAIQTLRIRQHRNVHSGHVVLISSHISSNLYPRATRLRHLPRLSLLPRLAPCELVAASREYNVPRGGLRNAKATRCK